MEYALLRSLRALGPGLLILAYVDLFFALAGSHTPFWSMDSAKLFLIGYAVGGIYGVIATVLKRDRYAFKGVNDSILAALRKFAPEIGNRPWNDVSPCFYALIDNDKSLEQKSKGMYFNGFLVTTSFDAIWISLGSVVIGVVAGLCRSEWNFLLVSGMATVVAYLVWKISNKRHRDLAGEQVNVIKKRFPRQFKECVIGPLSEPDGRTR